MGYGIIIIRDKQAELVTMGVLKLYQLSEHEDKLKKIFDRTVSLIEEYHPDELAIEAPFFGKNVQSMLKLGRAQGVLMAAGLYRSLPIFEYAPLLVKQSITGMGRASKEQVAWFLQKTFHLSDLPRELDATDAVAVAICHHLQQSRPTISSDYRNWEDFIRKNPGRVK